MLTPPSSPPAASTNADAAARGHALRPKLERRALLLAFAALGVVYGDIGTSPLYALRACFGAQGVQPTPENVYGVLSLVFWSLVLVISVWYLGFILRADNRGEGGILALMALATARRGRRSARERRVLIALGLFGAALLYGDGAITPAISVLGAMEGLEQATPALVPYIVPLTVSVLVALFLIQKRGTAGVAALFSPVTVVWFLCIAALGTAEILRNPRVVGAVSPHYAVRFLAEHGVAAFLVVGFVFLVVTGGEALYADMGHFGKQPIRVAWFGLALPALLLNYFGQGALLLVEPAAARNPFYELVPDALLYPMIAVSTAAAIVASQALISGVFSLTRQARQLDYVPRLRIVHTSEQQMGQIYIPAANYALMLGCVALVIGFRSSDALAAAYGIAVSATMAITTVLFYVVARDRLAWRKAPAAAICGLFLTINLAFLSANSVKLLEGGWFPLSVAAVIYLMMTTWQAGGAILRRIGQQLTLPIERVLEDLKRRQVPRVPGTAVFMSNTAPGAAPLVLLHHLKHNRAVHERVILLSILTEEVPVVAEERRAETSELEQGFYIVTARYGFKETPNAPEALRLSAPLKDVLKPQETTYYLGRQTLIPTNRPGLSGWRKRLYRFMFRNALRATAYFGLPPNRVVELGAQVQF